MTRLLRFGLISAMGLTTDVALYVLLFRRGLPPGYANAVSAGVAVSLVFGLSQRRLFRYEGRFLGPLFGAYLLYQVAAVAAASAAVGALVAQISLSALAAKAVVTPATFCCNYVFMTLLLSGPVDRARLLRPGAGRAEVRR